MPSSTRFAVSVHALSLLSLMPRTPQRSEDVARSVGTSPAVVRRIMGLLAQAGLVRTSLGQGGGTSLARRPEEISLLDVYRAVEEPGILALHRSTPSQACYVGHNILPVLTREMARVEAAMAASLAEVSLAGIGRRIEREAGYRFDGDMRFKPPRRSSMRKNPP